jgi:hypothetical protein
MEIGENGLKDGLSYKHLSEIQTHTDIGSTLGPNSAQSSGGLIKIFITKSRLVRRATTLI